MRKKILVAYASRYGSTAEVAAAIGEVLREQGFDVDVGPVRDVQHISTYHAVIIGTSVRVYRLLPEAIEFARQNRAILADIPAAYFVTGLMMKDARPEKLRRVQTMLNRLREIKEPIDTALFSGKLENARLEGPWRFYFRRISAMREGDYRDWGAIRKWAAELAGKL